MAKGLATGGPKPPCTRECTRRKPACQNATYCPDWAKYEEKKAAYNEAVANDQTRLFYAYVGQRGKTRRKYREHRKKETT